jgi:hypothetical protein
MHVLENRREGELVCVYVYREREREREREKKHMPIKEQTKHE